MSHDFESVDFDPVAALAAVSVSLPFEDAQPLNNLAEYENIVKPKKAVANTSEKPSLSKKKKAALRASQAPNYFNSYKPRKKAKNILTIMEDIEGPLARLRQCMKDKTTIKVWTRSAKEMRGVCTGYLQAFDRHWNLILSDVDETYVFPGKIKSVPTAEEEFSEDVENIAVVGSIQEESASPNNSSQQSTDVHVKMDESAARKRGSKKRSQIRQRHVNQIFIRGDNVALVSTGVNS